MTKQEFWKKIGYVFENYDITCVNCPACGDDGCSTSCEQALKSVYERLERDKVSDYKCKVRIIRDMEIIIHAKNKKEAEEEAKDWCKRGLGLPLGEHAEVLEIERMTAKKKTQERDEDGLGINENASEKEKLKAEINDFFRGLNSTCAIDYKAYSQIYDVVMPIIDEMHKLMERDSDGRVPQNNK